MSSVVYVCEGVLYDVKIPCPVTAGPSTALMAGR
jgi:hypothetical protein